MRCSRSKAARSTFAAPGESRAADGGILSTCSERDRLGGKRLRSALVWMLGLIVTLVVGYAAVTVAQDVVVPVDVQYLFLLKILTYDRNFRIRVGEGVVIGILYQRKFKRSLDFKEELTRVIDRSGIEEIDSIPLRCVPVDLGEDVNLDSLVTKHKLDVLYVAPLRSFDIRTIAALSRARKITTFASVPEYVESGLSVGIGAKDHKPQLIINLAAAKAEGCDFDSELLKLAEVIE
jgi:hypothetical protein